jgi:hypothetical protein
MKYAGADTIALDAVVAKPRDFRLREDLADKLKINHDDEEVRFALSNARWILTAHRLDGPRRGTEVIREGNDTVIRSLWADRARWIWQNLTDAGVRQAIFASATLAVGDQTVLSLRRYGVPLEAVKGDSFSPRRFGPIKDGAVNTAWQEEASLWLSSKGLTRKGSRPLVLAKSYADTSFFAERLGIAGHERGHHRRGHPSPSLFTSR